MRMWMLLLIVAGACSRGETSEPVEKAPEAAAEPEAEETLKSEEQAAPEAPPAPPPGLEAPIDLDSPPSVVLVDAGKAPHKALRARFEAGAKQSLQVESLWSLETVYGPTVRTEAVMPTLVYELETEVKEASDDGARFEFRVAKVTAKSREGVKPGRLEATKTIGASLEGKTGSFSINPRGMVEDLTMDAPSDTSLLANDMIDQIKAAIRLCSLPLPEEPVGRGAKWTATQVLEQRTARFRHTSTFELTGTRGNRVKATGAHAAEAPKQELALPGSRSALKLDKIELSGGTEGAWPLNRLGPPSVKDDTVSVFMMMATKPKREVVVMAVHTTLEVKAKR